MKQIVVLLLILGIGVGAYAGPSVSQPVRSGRVVVVSPRPVYRPHYYNRYSTFGWRYNSPYYGYGYGYSPYWGWSNTVPVQETQADLAVQEVRNDFGYQIANVRHDKSLSKAERKARIRQLRHERDQAIIEAKRKYY